MKVILESPTRIIFIGGDPDENSTGYFHRPALVSETAYPTPEGEEDD